MKKIFNYALLTLLFLGSVACQTARIQAEAGNLTRITPLDESQSSPYWLPDSQRLIVHGRKGWQVVSVDDGASEAQLTNRSLYLFEIAADGSRALFGELSDFPSGHINLFVMTTDGRERTDIPLPADTVIRQEVLSPSGKRLVYTHQGGLFLLEGDAYESSYTLYSESVRFMSWSPNEQWFAYTTKDELRLVDVATKETTVLYQVSGPFQIDQLSNKPVPKVTNAIWSPDNQKILFWAEENPFVYDLSKQAALELPPDFLVVSWSSDSLTLYSGRCANASSLDLVDMTRQYVAINIPEYDGSLSCTWSPDGSRILIRTVESEEGNIVTTNYYMIKVDTQELIQLTSGTDVKGMAGWSPDRTKIVFESHYVRGASSKVYVLEVP